jgi:citronellol/citronellal dehydrogenase
MVLLPDGSRGANPPKGRFWARVAVVAIGEHVTRTWKWTHPLLRKKGHDWCGYLVCGLVCSSIALAVINNASAISNTPTLDTAMKRYDLMHTVNGRGTFLVTKTCLPHLLKSKHTPHVLTLSPPLNLDPRWVSMAGPAYTAAKYNMSLFTLGWAEEFRGKVACNALWPRTAIATAAIEMLAGKAGMLASRSPEIMADAAHAILSQDINYTGNFCIDDDTLKALAGASDADVAKYNNSPLLMPDFYIGDPEDIKKWVDAGSMMSKVAGMFGGKRA